MAGTKAQLKYDVCRSPGSKARRAAIGIARIHVYDWGSRTPRSPLAMPMHVMLCYCYVMPMCG